MAAHPTMYLKKEIFEKYGDYKIDYIDKNTGCANILHFKDKDGKDIIIGANREIDEVAYYTVTE